MRRRRSRRKEEEKSARQRGVKAAQRPVALVVHTYNLQTATTLLILYRAHSQSIFFPRQKNVVFPFSFSPVSPTDLSLDCNRRCSALAEHARQNDIHTETHREERTQHRGAVLPTAFRSSSHMVLGSTSRRNCVQATQASTDKQNGGDSGARAPGPGRAKRQRTPPTAGH